MSGTLIMQGSFPTATGTQQINLSQLVLAPVGEQLVLQLASGPNPITVPNGSTLCIIQFPAANAQAVTLKGASGDTGIALNKNGLNILTLDSSVSQFVINAAAAINFNTSIIFL